MDVPRKLHELSSDELYSIAIMLDYPDLLRFCSSSNRINDIICKRNKIWEYRLSRDFPNAKLRLETPKETYKRLHEIFMTIRRIIKIYKSLLEQFSNEETIDERDLDRFISEIKSLEKYGYFKFNHNFIKEMFENTRNNDIFVLNHFIDNSYKALRYGRNIPVYSLRDFVNEIGIDWNSVNK